MPDTPIGVQIAHWVRVFGADMMELLLAWDTGMWEFGDDVSGNL